jgi:hypothetical protein
MEIFHMDNHEICSLSFIFVIVSLNKDSYLIWLILEFFNFCLTELNLDNMLPSAPFSSFNLSEKICSTGSNLWLLCLNETQDDHRFYRTGDLQLAM